MALTTADLITRLARPGAEAAWSELAERHGQDVWRLIASRLGDAHAVEDAYQEFWLGLPAAARRFTPLAGDTERKARAWLMHIAYTTAIAQHRQRRHGAELSEDAVTTAEDAMDDAPDQELVARVRQAVERLPETHRQPLLLHTVGGLSYEDLAAELRCTVNNARVKVHRAIAALRTLVGPEGGRLPEGGLASLLIPAVLLVPPPAPPPLPPMPPPGVLAVLAKAPLAVGAGVAATATAVVATAVVIASPSTPEPPVSPTATIAAIAAVATLSASDDFNRATPEIRSPDPTVTVSMVDAPAGGTGKALCVAWLKEHKSYWQVVYAPYRPAPEVTSAGATVTARIWVEAMAGVTGLALRFIDAHDETFQWSAPLPDPDKAGWRTITVSIDPQKPSSSWGPEGKVDKIIDWPVRFGGFASQFTGPNAPAGSMIIDDIVVTAATKP